MGKNISECPSSAPFFFVLFSGIHTCFAAIFPRNAQGQPEEAHETHNRHAHYYLTFIQAREAALRGECAKDALPEIQREIGNMRAAWSWAVGQREIDLVVHNVRDHAHAAEVAAVLKSDVSSVADISLLRFADGTAEYGVQYRGWPEHLANELQMAYFRNRYFGSTLDSINGNKLVIRIRRSYGLR